MDSTKPSVVKPATGDDSSATRARLPSARFARMAGIRPGETVRAKVHAVMDHGIYLERSGVQILVHVVDVEWYHTTLPQEYAQVGDELEVTILRMTNDGRMASGWLASPPTPSQRTAG